MNIIGTILNSIRHPLETATHAAQSAKSAVTCATQRCYNGIRHPLETATYAAQLAKRTYQRLPYGVKVMGVAAAMTGVAAYALSTVYHLSQPSSTRISHPPYRTSWFLNNLGMEEEYGRELFLYSGAEGASDDDYIAPFSFLDRQKCDPTSCGLYPNSIMEITQILGPSHLSNMIQQLQQVFPQTAIAILAPLVGVTALTAYHKFIQTVLPLQELSITSTWEKGLYGTVYAPAALLAGWISQLAGVSMEVLDTNIISEVYQGTANTPILSLLAHMPLLLGAAGFEECMFRAILQGFICTTLPHMLLQKVCPSEKAQAIVDHKISRFFRVLSSALLFSACHLQNPFSNEAQKLQLFNTFGMGLVCASLQELMGNAWGAVGLHAAFNATPLMARLINQK